MMNAPYRRLDKDDVALLLVDHQTGLLSLVRDIDPDRFKNNVLALTGLGRYFGLPTILTTSFFNALTRDSAWDRMSAAGAQLMTWFGVACELHRDWRNDVEGLGQLFSNHIPDYRNLMNSYAALTSGQQR